MSSPRSLRGLDGLNFFLADVQTGVGPFVAIVLASQGLGARAIGIALTFGGLAGVLSQVPLGAWVDATRHKRGLLAGAILTTAAAAIVLALGPGLPLILAAQALHGVSTGVMGPAVVALSLGMAGRGQLGQRLGKSAGSTRPATSSPRRSWGWRATPCRRSRSSGSRRSWPSPRWPPSR